MITRDKKKLTGRQKRMQHFQNMHSKSGLNLVSLMDIFTILVFFLLVNSSSQQLPSGKEMKLPASVATKVPQETLVVAITKDTILVAGRKVAQVNAVLASPGPIISPLVTELQYQTSVSAFDKGEKDRPHAVTILGDETMPYELLHKILTSCRQANYTHIAFATLQKAKGNA